MSLPPYKIIRSQRRTLALQLLPDGTLLIRCPQKMPEQEALRFVKEKQDWIQKHMDRLPPPQPPLTQQQLYELARQAQTDLPPRLEKYAAALQVRFGKVTIRAQHSLWGSCSSKGNLSYNCLIMLMPEEVRDYIVVHELCHLLEFNHSKRFWALVESVIPNYRQHLAWLKENGSSLLSKLPK